MTKRALCVGINDYPGTGADLRGCVNDARDWAAKLTELGYECVTVLDSGASKSTVVTYLKAMVGQAKFGDRIVFTYSGHGTWLPDKDGDEIDGRDEALVMYDYSVGGYLMDDELHDIFATARFGVRVVVISDSCHSGTMSRFVSPDRAHSTASGDPRFLSPAVLPNVEVRSLEEAARAEDRVPTNRSRVFGGIVLLSGCADPEFSYDAYIGGRPRGAFTAAALDTLDLNPRLGRWHHNIRQLLPSSSYPQTPQLQVAKRHQKRWSL